MLPGLVARYGLRAMGLQRLAPGLKVVDLMDEVFDAERVKILEELKRELVRLQRTLEREFGSIKVTTNFSEVNRQLDQLRSDLVDRALVRALNRTIDWARAEMSRRIRAEYNIKAGKVNSELRVEHATFGHGRRQVTLFVPAGKRSLNLIHFNARQTKRGVSVLVKKGGARKVIPGAFIANDNKTVFKRVGKSRLPIKALQTIDVPQMFNTERIRRSVESQLPEKFKKNFEHEASYYINRFNSRSGR
jgi:hypothetical protein